MNGVAQTRTVAGGRGAAPCPVRTEGVRRRAGLLTAYGWAAGCTLLAVTLLAAALALH